MGNLLETIFAMIATKTHTAEKSCQKCLSLTLRKEELYILSRERRLLFSQPIEIEIEPPFCLFVYLREKTKI